MTTVEITFLPINFTCNIVCLHIPFALLMFLKSVTGTQTFSLIWWLGILECHSKFIVETIYLEFLHVIGNVCMNWSKFFFFYQILKIKLKLLTCSTYLVVERVLLYHKKTHESIYYLEFLYVISNSKWFLYQILKIKLKLLTCSTYLVVERVLLHHKKNPWVIILW